MALVYIDFHTHKYKIDDTCVAIESFDPSKNNLSLSKQNLYTLGVHPWNASVENIERYTKEIKEHTTDIQMVGVGEIGLDKLNGPDMPTQIKIFENQLDIAYQIHKPITIHCVKAWDELLAIRTKFTDKIPWAIHGFVGSPQLAKQLLSKGFFLSIGAAILNQGSKLQQAIFEIPLDRLFLETDTSQTSIQEIYAVVAEKTGVSTEVLQKSIADNFSYFFRR